MAGVPESAAAGVVDAEALDETPDASASDSAPVRPRRRRGRKGGQPPGKPLWIRLHRWVSLAFGLVLLLEVVSGAIQTMKPELDRIGAGERFVSTASANPMPAKDALALARERYPDMSAEYVNLYRGVWQVGSAETAEVKRRIYIDPGTGRINAVTGQEAWILRALVNLHDCALSCAGYPLYAPVMNWTPWSDVTIHQHVLGLLGLLLAFLCLSGIYIWWPTIRKFSSGFKVRRGRGAYVRDLDLHKVVGIVAVPFLLMWAISGTNFEYRWPEKVYYAILPGSNPGDPPELVPGNGPVMTFEQAEAKARELYPTTRLVGLYGTDPNGEAGYYGFTFARGVDMYKHSYGEGTDYVEVDSRGGGVKVYPKATGPVTERYWETWQNGLHFGSLVPWVPRFLLFTLFGLTPILLAVTGITVWLTKRASRRNRAER